MYGRILRIQGNCFQPRKTAYTNLHGWLYFHTGSNKRIGVQIIFSHTGIETKLLNYERGLGNASISQAELTAVHTALRWYVFENQYHYTDKNKLCELM